MYVSDFAMSEKFHPVDFESRKAKNIREECLEEENVSITIFLCHVPVIY
jgi:hypothetical protein